MRMMFLGDVVGRSGRDAALAALPDLVRSNAADFIVVNAENAAGGYGLTPEIADQLFAAGADVITTGNHIWDQKSIIGHIDRDPRILRPINFPVGTPGRGAHLYVARNGAKIYVLNVMGRLFMDALDDPFAACDRELAKHRLGQTADAILIDVHAEASSEKMALAHHCDGRVSFVVGTHTHIPTADAQILPGGTAYQTDAGMCGDYDSVIGMKKQISVQKFIRKMPGEKNTPAEGPGTVCGVSVDVDPGTGLATLIRPFRIGGRLAEALPPTAPGLKAVA